MFELGTRWPVVEFLQAEVRDRLLSWIGVIECLVAPSTSEVQPVRGISSWLGSGEGVCGRIVFEEVCDRDGIPAATFVSDVYKCFIMDVAPVSPLVQNIQLSPETDAYPSVG